jgi:hypothetical protein
LPTSTQPNWKYSIQLPGSVVVLYLGWFVGPFATVMTPPVACVLTIFINALAYYALVRTVLFFSQKSRLRP